MQTDLPLVKPVQAPLLGVIETGVAPDGSVTVTRTPWMVVAVVLRIVKRVFPMLPAVKVFGVTVGVMVRAPDVAAVNVAVTVVFAVSVT